MAAGLLECQNMAMLLSPPIPAAGMQGARNIGITDQLPSSSSSTTTFKTQLLFPPDRVPPKSKVTYTPKVVFSLTGYSLRISLRFSQIDETPPMSIMGGHIDESAMSGPRHRMVHAMAYNTTLLLAETTHLIGRRMSVRE